MAVLHQQTGALGIFDIRRESAATQRGGLGGVGFTEGIPNCISQVLSLWGNRGRDLVNGRKRGQSEKAFVIFPRLLVRFANLVARWTLDRLCQIPLQYLH